MQWSSHDDVRKDALAELAERAVKAGKHALLRFVQVRTTPSDPWRLAFGRIDLARPTDLPQPPGAEDLGVARSLIEQVDGAEFLVRWNRTLNGAPFSCDSVLLPSGIFCLVGSTGAVRRFSSLVDYGHGWPCLELSTPLPDRYPEPHNKLMGKAGSTPRADATEFIRSLSGFGAYQGANPVGQDARLERLTVLDRDYRGRIIKASIKEKAQSASIVLDGDDLSELLVWAAVPQSNGQWLDGPTVVAQASVEAPIALSERRQLRVQLGAQGDLIDEVVVDLEVTESRSDRGLGNTSVAEAKVSGGPYKPQTSSVDAFGGTSRVFGLMFENAYIKKKGNEFQDFFASIMEKAFPGDFMRSRPWGNSGDRKSDGYLSSRRTLFASYAPAKMVVSKWVKKIEEDFNGALPHWRTHFGTWVLVHNSREGLPPHVMTRLLDLGKAHPEIVVSPWGFEELRKIALGLSHEDLESLLGTPPTGSITPQSQPATLDQTVDRTNRWLPLVAKPDSIGEMGAVSWRLAIERQDPFQGTKAKLFEALHTAIVAHRYGNNPPTRWPRAFNETQNRLNDGTRVWTFSYKGDNPYAAGDEQLALSTIGELTFQRDSVCNGEGVVDFYLLAGDVLLFLVIACRFGPLAGLTRSTVTLNLRVPQSANGVLGLFNNNIEEPNASGAARLHKAHAGGSVVLSVPNAGTALALVDEAKELLDRVANEFELAPSTRRHGNAPNFPSLDRNALKKLADALDIVPA